MKNCHTAKQYLKFLKWLEDGPKPWLRPYMREWRARWDHWDTMARRHNPLLPGGTAFITNATSAKEYALRKAFYYWKRMRYIEISEEGTELIIRLTDHGRLRLYHEACQTARRLPKGQVLMILFDIPEVARSSRQVLRAFLKRNGFNQLQFSVWYTYYDTGNALVSFLQYLELDRWVFVGVIEVARSWATTLTVKEQNEHAKRAFQEVYQQEKMLSKNRRPSRK